VNVTSAGWYVSSRSSDELAVLLRLLTYFTKVCSELLCCCSDPSALSMTAPSAGDKQQQEQEQDDADSDVEFS